MPNPLCCTSPQRSDSPDLPNARVAEALNVPPNTHGNLQVDEASRAQPTRTEDLRALQKIFEEAVSTATLKESQLTSAWSPQSADIQTNLSRDRDEDLSPASLKDRLRKRLSQNVTKSSSNFLRKIAGKDNLETKSSNAEDSSATSMFSQANLLSVRVDGNYDSDAEVLVAEDVINRVSFTPVDGRGSPVRSLKESGRKRLKSINWEGGVSEE